ncbi:hypothetical protein SAMN05216559_0258 [Halomicrobium zhouii]|uniref:CHAT domain-containing protein n=1 Tax=Halomicrobium zhouii TaxID=767519 RepID=A0A1I6K673_9EURY|nr:hypothetical protein [Halomicrobium zhouii]SFR86739.1 hypothetical protein SAMN05216559_0258 [Halomicrobium zhouii]
MRDTTPDVEPITGPTGIRISDPIESAQFTLLTPVPVHPTRADTDAFALPVDTAATVTVTELETPHLVDVWVRDADVNLVAQCTSGESVSLPPGEYYVELSSAKMKLYLGVEGGVDVEPRDGRVRLTFPDAASVTVGARSFHEQPAATIQTTTDPADVATALSHLGSALKTLSCERSFPTLRGHPPLIELGPELDVPEAIEAPDTGVTIEVPPDLGHLFPVASLAYYLGATVEIGEKPVLRADGASFPLDADGDFEATVTRTLRQVFLLDCVTRTEGYYDVDLHERGLVEDAVDLDFAALYDEPLAAQLREYLAVPYEAVAGAVPAWKLTADVVPDAEHVSALPFLANELAAIRCPAAATLQSRSLDDSTPEVRSFFRGPPGVDAARLGGATARSSLVHGSATRSSGPERNDDESTTDELVFEPPPADSIEQTYIGPGVPLGASKITVDQLYRRLAVEPTADERIRVLVVCNDPAMREENAVGDVYGMREWIEFDITTREGVTTDELTDLLREHYDFLHYIGHVDDDGIRCADGHLDARSLTEVNVGAFLLNACQSYDQGQGLVDAGALGGVVTLTEVLNRTATEIGRTVSHLLNQGFSLLSMLDLLEESHRLAQRYMVVGDGNVSIVQSESGTPMSASIERSGDGRFEMELFGYASRNYQLGTLVTPYVNDENVRYVNPGVLDTFSVGREDLDEILGMQEFPVTIDGDLYWSNEISASQLD